MKKVKRYFVVYRPIMNSAWIIRELLDGDTEILQDAEKFYEETIGNSERIELDGHEYFWQEWASKKLFQEVWIEDVEDENDAELYNFSDLTEALEYLEEEYGKTI